MHCDGIINTGGYVQGPIIERDVQSGGLPLDSTAACKD